MSADNPYLATGWMLIIGAFVVSILIGFAMLLIASVSKTLSNPNFGIDEKPTDQE